MSGIHRRVDRIVHRLASIPDSYLGERFYRGECERLRCRMVRGTRDGVRYASSPVRRARNC